jgi:hypothetical protein
MLLLLRRLKHGVFVNREFRKYLLYAFGEMVLVIVGILIALQIDNWNTDRQEQKLLGGYLQSIARNMQEDAAELEALREARVSAVDASVRAANFLLESRARTFDVSEVFFAVNAMSQVGRIVSFHPNTSGMEALKTSGVLARMQGRDIERLLYEYYDTARRVEDREKAYNDRVSRLGLQTTTAWPGDVEGFALWDPSALSTERFLELQPVYREYLGSSVTRAQLTAPFGFTPVVLQYDKLESLGAAFRRLVEAGATDLDEESRRALDSIYAESSPVGFADLIVDGQIAWHTYYVAGESDLGREKVFDFRSVEKNGDSLRITYPGGTQWGALWLAIDRVAEERPSLDFSGFDKLSLEMRLDSGSKSVRVHLKDADDPDDGTQTNVEFVLNDDWQLFEIDLDRFETADLSALIIPLGFVFAGEPQSFSIRNARYLDDD